jgi:hypothetical protein
MQACQFKPGDSAVIDDNVDKADDGKPGDIEGVQQTQAQWYLTSTC